MAPYIRRAGSSPVMLSEKKLFVIGPTESLLTKRGDRFPAFAKFAVAEGFSVTFLTSNFDHAEKRWFSSDEIAHAKSSAPYNLRVFRVLGYFSNVSARRVISNFLFSLCCFFYLVCRYRSGDTIFIPSRPVEIIFFSSLIGRLRGAKVVVDIQDIWPDMLISNSYRKRKIFEIYCNFYLKRSLPYIKRYINVAPAFVGWLQRYSSSATSTFVPLGYDSTRWGEVVDESEYKSESHVRLRIGCVAMLQKQIDVLPFVKAIRGMENVELVIIGEDGQGERYHEVSEWLTGHQVTNVRFLGRLSRDRVVKELSSCNVGLVPMISNSIPNKVFDYIGAGLPQIVLGDNDAAELIVQNGLGWQVDFDSRAISTLLMELSPDRIRAKRTSVLENRLRFSRENLQRKILEVVDA